MIASSPSQLNKLKKGENTVRNTRTIGINLLENKFSKEIIKKKGTPT